MSLLQAQHHAPDVVSQALRKLHTANVRELGACDSNVCQQQAATLSGSVQHACGLQLDGAGRNICLNLADASAAHCSVQGCLAKALREERGGPPSLLGTIGSIGALAPVHTESFRVSVLARPGPDGLQAVLFAAAEQQATMLICQCTRLVPGC